MDIYDKVSLNRQVNVKRNELRSLYGTCSDNLDRINYVIDNVYRPQLLRCTKSEYEVFEYLVNHGFSPKFQEFVPILDSGGLLQHLYLSDIFIDPNIIVEVDGSFHGNQEQRMRDSYRDEQTSGKGYKTFRINVSDISKESLNELVNNIKDYQDNK